MPIKSSSPITIFNQDEFHDVDRTVKGHAFNIHNQLGRFLDEKLYQNELALRMQSGGHLAEREVTITLSLGSFFQEYFIDLLIDSGVVIETKAVKALSNAHQAQTLNYLYITELHHGSLINFRSESVECKFVSTKLTYDKRLRFTFDTTNWQPLSTACDTLLNSLSAALTEWGWGLQTTLYRNYLIHTLGGEGSVMQEIPIITQHGLIGKQQTPLLSEEVAFAITSVTKSQAKIREHQYRFLKHTNLKAIHWINMNRGTIHLETIQKHKDSTHET